MTSFNLQLSQYNPSSSKSREELRLERNFNRPLIADTTDVEFSITKFSVPISSNPLFRVPSGTTDYDINITTSCPMNTGSSDRVFTGTASLTPGAYYSTDEIISEINRRFLTAYADLLENGDCMVDTPMFGLAIFTNISPSISLGLITKPADTLFLVKLRLRVAVLNNGRYNVILESPTGLKCTVCSNAYLMAGATYEFADDNITTPNDVFLTGFQPGSNSEQAGDIYRETNVGIRKLTPLDSFQKFNLADPDGTWVIRFYSLDSGAYTNEANARVTTYYSYNRSNNVFPMYAPFIKMDKTVSPPTFTWVMDERMLINCNVHLGSALQEILALDKLNYTDGYLHKIHFPSRPFTGTDYTLYTSYPQLFLQSSPSVYKLSQIQELQFFSPSFAITNRDLINSDLSSMLISSFDINADELQAFDYVNYVYTSSEKPLRRYKLSQGQTINEIVIYIRVKYRDDSTEIVQLSPFQSASLTLTFFEPN
jgi:hypothetical protein